MTEFGNPGSALSTSASMHAAVTDVTDSHAAFHDPTQAVLQVRSTVGVAWLHDLALLEFTGPDAERFLQNRLSNDVAALKTGEGQMDAALDRQAKIEGVFSLHRTTHGYFALVDKAEVESTLKGIEKYRIIEQVQIRDMTEGSAFFTCQGPLALELMLKAAAQGVHGEELSGLPELGFVDTVLLGMPVRLVRRSDSGENGYLLICDRLLADPIWSALLSEAQSVGGVLMSDAVREVLRIEAGLPRHGLDYSADTLLPETGLERQAVSYSKGCYLGQETVARVKTYGMLPKALVGLKLEKDAPLPPAGSDCALDGKSVGNITGAVFSPTLNQPIAMAYLGKSERVPGKTLAMTINGHPHQATVTLLPFYDAQAQSKSGTDWLAEGLKLFEEGFDEEAVRILRLATDADPELVEAYEALGVILSRQDRFDEAIEMMNRVLALDPDHVLAHTNLSVFYMKQGDKEKAEEEKAKATMAAFSRKAKESGLVFDLEAERRRKEQATLDKIQMFQEALKFNPGDPLGNFGLGSAYLELKRYDEAIEPLQSVLKAQPKHSVAWLSLGKAMEGAQRPDEACDTYRQGIEVAAAKGDLMPLKEMQARLAALEPG